MLEIVAMTAKDAKLIEAGGADRIGLASALHEGGLTPSYGLIKAVVQAVKIPVNIIVRPQTKGFHYSSEEIEIMKQDILIAKELNVKGVMFGVLDVHENVVDVNKLEKLLSVCDGLEVIFSRAIDKVRDLAAAVRLLSHYPQVKSVLTSGGRGPISDNISTIREMAANAGQLHIRVGGGIRFDNFEKLMSEVDTPYYHVGAAARENSSLFGDVCIENVERLVQMVRGYHKKTQAD